MEARRDVFQAIADPTRREIISLLSTQQMNLNAIAENFRVSRPAISQHIKLLAECGLVSIQQRGRERICEARLSKLSEVARWVKRYETFWNTRLDALEKLLDDNARAAKQKKKKHNKRSL